MNHSPILLGTSSFTATGWRGSFYPKGLRPADYLSYYAQHFDTLEIDSTFYATPNVSVVRSWDAETPQGVLFAAKVPQEITYERSGASAWEAACGRGRSQDCQSAQERRILGDGLPGNRTQ